MPDLGKAYVQIVPSATGIKGQIQNAMSGEADSAAKHIGSGMGGKIVSAIKGAIAAAGFGKIIADAFNASAELQQNVGGIEKIYGDAADTVAKNAQNAFKTAQISANQYMGLATTFGASLLKSTGGDTQKAADQTEKAIRQISDNYNTFGGDIENLKQAYNNFARGQFTMLDNLKLGYSGSKEGMQELLKDAEAISGVHYDINNFSDIVDAIDVVQEHLNIAGTSAKEAGSTIEGSMNMLKSSWANVMSTIGMSGQKEAEEMGFIWKDALDGLVESLGTFVQNAIPALQGIMEALPQVIATMLTKGLPMLVDGGVKIVSSLITGFQKAIPTFVQEGPTMIQSILTSIVNGLPQLIAGGAQLITAIANGLVTGIPNLVLALTDAIPRLVQGLVESGAQLVQAGFALIFALSQGLIESIPALVTMIPTIVQTLLSYFIQNAVTMVTAGLEIIMALLQGIMQALPAILAALPEIFAAMQESFTGFDWATVGGTVVELLVAGINMVFDMLPEILQLIAETGAKLMESIDWVGLGSTVINFIVRGISALVRNIPDILGSIAQSGLEMFAGIDWLGLGGDVVMGIVNGIVGMGSVLFDTLLNLASSALDAAKRFLGIGSPSKVFAKEVGKWIPPGIAIGVEDNLDPVKTAMDELSNVTTAQYAAEVSANAKYTPAGTNAETTNYGGVAINVYGAEGQDVRQLANEIEKILVNKTLRQEAVFA